MIAAAVILTAGKTIAQSSPDPLVPRRPQVAGAVNADWRWSLTQNGIYGQMPAKGHTGQPIPWQPVAEAGMVWKKRVWREISTLEKQNMALRYAGDERTGGGMFIEILIDAVTKGKVPAYSTEDNRFTTMLTKREVDEMVQGKIDTLYVVDINDSEVMKIRVNEFDPAVVTKYRLIEDWFFDSNTGQMVVRVAGIAPVRDIYGESGQYRGSQAMFWLYYPEIRGLLAGYEATNPVNDAHRPTWEEFFEGRMFSGRITKVSNTLGTFGGSYGESLSEKGLSPMEALHEGKRIADQIFNEEHDMWNY